MTQENELYIRERVENTSKFKEAEEQLLDILPSSEDGDVDIFVEVPSKQITSFGATEYTNLIVRAGTNNQGFRSEVGEVTIRTDFFVDEDVTGKHVEYELEAVDIDINTDIVKGLVSDLEQLYFD